MKTINLLLVFCTLCVFIVPTIQYGTIFTDFISTPVDFTDITETYISGIKSKEASAKSAVVDTITATNPDGFYVNSPGPLKASAGGNVEFTSAQTIQFGTVASDSTSLSSAGSFFSKNDRTDVDADEITLSTGDTLSLTSGGTLNIQGNDIDISSEGEGAFGGRDITVSSATFADIVASGNILLNSTYHSSFITQYGDIEIYASDQTIFDANFVNIKSSLGVDINADANINIAAYAVLEMQAAQFAQVSAVSNISINVQNGDFDVYAAATVAIASEEDLTFISVYDFDIHSFGDSESIVQLNARNGLLTLTAENALQLGTFVNSYDVDLISNGALASFSSTTAFLANNYVSHIAGNDIVYSIDETIELLGLDFEADIDQDITINSIFDSLALNTFGNLVGEARNVVFRSQSNINIDAEEVSFLQGSPAILTRSEPTNLAVHTQNTIISTKNTQFDTSGDLIFNAATASLTGNTVHIRSSEGAHSITFVTQNTTTLQAADDLKFISSNIRMTAGLDYNAFANSINVLSESDSTNIFTSVFDTYFNSVFTSIFTSGLFKTEAAVGTIVTSTNSIVHNSYDTDITSRGSIYINSTEQIAIGAREFINAESVDGSIFTSDSVYVHATQTGSLFAEDLFTSVTNENFNAGDTLYFTANIPTDSLLFSSKNAITFTATTEFEAGRALVVKSVQSSFTGNTLLIDGYDENTIHTTNFTGVATSSITVSSDGSFTANSNRLTASSTQSTIFTGDDDGYFSAQSVSFSAGGSGTQTGEDLVLIRGYSSVEITSKNANTITSDNVNFLSEGVNTVTATTGDFTINTDSATYYAPINTLKTTVGAMNLFSQDNNIRSTSSSTFTASSGVFSVNGTDIWLLGDSFTGNSSTQFFSIGGAGSFLSDDQITFNVKNGITATSKSLEFVLPLDGTLHMAGAATRFTGTGTNSSFTFQSRGATQIIAEGTMRYTAGSYVSFDSFISNFDFTTSISLSTITRASNIDFSAAEGEVNFATTSWSVLANTNSYLASRDINFRGNIVFDSEKQTAQTFNPTPYVSNVNDNIGIWAETVHEDSHIVFDNQAGTISNTAASNIFVGAVTTQSYVSGSTFQSKATAGSTTFTVDGNHKLHTSTGATFAATNDYSLTGKGLIYIESGDHMSFSETLAATVSNQVLFSIKAGNNLLISTSGDGPLSIDSDQGMTYTTSSFQNWIITHSASTTSGTSTYKSTQSDIVTMTSAGPISYDYSSYTGNAGTNVTFISGHDATFTGLDYTFTAGQDVISTSIAGFLDFQANITSFTASTGQLSIDSEGVRTIPRDGVYFGSNDIEVVTTGAGSAVNLYARRSVTFGEFTRPIVSFYGGGSPTQNGFTLNSDGSIKLTSLSDTTFSASANGQTNTAQASVFSSGGPLTIHTDGTNPPSPASVYISSSNGNVHFQSQLDSTWTTTQQFAATATGSIQFTTLNQATFTSSIDIQESANSLALSFDNSYVSSSTGLTSIDGHTSFAISTSEFGNVAFNGDDNTFSTGVQFSASTYGDDAKFQFKAQNITLSTTKSGATLNFDSSGGIFTASGSLNIAATESYSVTSQSTTSENPEDGSIFYISKGQMNINAVDTIDISTTRDAHILIDSNAFFTSTGTLTFNSYWDQEWNFNTAPSDFNFTLTTIGLTMTNSAGQGGDITFTSPGIRDLIFFDVTGTTGSTILTIGNNFVSHATDGLQIRSTGTDFKDSYGLRFQTEGTNADLEFAASGSTFFSALVNTRFDASANLNVFGGYGMAVVAQGTNNLGQGAIFGAAIGDISFTAAQSPVSFIGNEVEIVGNGTDGTSGRIHLTANGIDKSSSYGINMQFDASVLAIGSISGNVEVYADQSIQINLDDIGAHALFGYQRNTFEELFSIFKNYYTPYNPYDPSKFINVPLQSRTKVLAHGTNADIVFETQNTEDGIGQFVAYAGTIEPYQFSELNAPSQLQLVAYGNADVTGDITFLLEGGITIRGLDRSNRNFNPINNTIVESDCLFLANDESSSIAIVTTKDAVFSNIDITTSELTLNAENKLNIRSTGRNGDSTVLIESGAPNSNRLGKIAVSTTGSSWGPGTALPGIELRSYRSNIRVDAGNLGDVIHHSLFSMTVEADNGYSFDSRGTLAFTTGNFIATSTEGNIKLGYQNVVLNAPTVSLRTSVSVGANFGDDVTIRSRAVSLFAGTQIVVQSENNVVFNFDSGAYLNSDIVTIAGSLTIPMIDQQIIVGTPCTPPSQPNVRSIFVARTPPYDAFKNYVGTPNQYDVNLNDVYQGLGLRLCLCSDNGSGNFLYQCLSLSQFLP